MLMLLGDRQLVSRPHPTPGLPALTPSLLTSILGGGTSEIFDISQYAHVQIGVTPAWKEDVDSGMFAVTNVLGPAGSVSYHGVCRIEGGGKEGEGED